MPIPTPTNTTHNSFESETAAITLSMLNTRSINSTDKTTIQKEFPLRAARFSASVCSLGVVSPSSLKARRIKYAAPTNLTHEYGSENLPGTALHRVQHRRPAIRLVVQRYAACRQEGLALHPTCQASLARVFPCHS